MHCLGLAPCGHRVHQGVPFWQASTCWGVTPQGKRGGAGLFQPAAGHEFGALAKQPTPGIVIPGQLPQIGMPGEALD